MVSRHIVLYSVIVTVSLLFCTLNQTNRSDDKKPKYVTRHGECGHEQLRKEVLWKMLIFHLADTSTSYLGPLLKGLTGKRTFL